jgi:hypothetical protein
MYQPYPGHETQLPPTQRPPAPAFLWRRTSSAYFRSAQA